MERTWKPTTAGILSIVAGVIGLIMGIVVVAVGEMAGAAAGIFGIGALGAPVIVLVIIAIVGGVFALRRRLWGLALAGAICALCVWILGIPAIIFIAMGKKEFA